MNFSTFFSKLQEAPWYRHFLNPVIINIAANSKILDIGTGSGKMLQILFQEKGVSGVGIDTSELMLEQAKKKLANTPFILSQIDAGINYPFEEASFDSVTICSVLFNMKEKEAVNQILSEARRVLKKNGKIIILTPTGKGNIIKLTKYFFSFKNVGMYIWYNATKKRAKTWTAQRYLQSYCIDNDLIYTIEQTMEGFAQVEVIMA